MTRWQEDQIRRTARSLGFDPLRLPFADQKTNVVKATIRTRCGQNQPVKMRAVIFNAAWDRMLAATPPGLGYSTAD